VSDPNVSQQLDVERVRLDEKHIALAMALEERIKQHRIERERCDLHIENCIKLSRLPGALKAELEKLIAGWQRIRQYHVNARQMNERLLREIST
jgi:hypothetical protein